LELAQQCVAGCFSGLDLAAGKFPVAGPDFVGRTLGEKEGSIGALQDGGGNFNNMLIFRRMFQ
jgi:hypothetical protein